LTPVPPSPTATESDVDLQAEVERLRTLLERQPSCLMRVGVNGTLLAVNDKALNLLGARGLEGVLGSSLVDRIDAEDTASLWEDFVRRVSNAGSASVECEMKDLAGVRRAVMVQAVTLPSHPDGDVSFLLTVRDVSTSRRLQASLQEQEELRRSAQHGLDDATASIQDLRTRLAEATVERDWLRATSETAAADRQQLSDALQQLKTALNSAIEATLLAQQLIEKGGRR
jgi:PAS domain S-box-containing protein